MGLIKPKHLSIGDTIASVSISHGWAGDDEIVWKYKLGKKRLEDVFGLHVQPAPNSMRGSNYLSKNPKARAEDIMWAFENKSINAIIANIGGNDSVSVLPFISSEVIKNNPKILIGYSDIMNIHLLCYKSGLSTFYGHNLLSTIAETHRLHSYSEKWFRKALFETAAIGDIEPSRDWTYKEEDYFDKDCILDYYPNSGYELVQGEGIVQGNLIGGHTGVSEFQNMLSDDDFQDAILFLEDIPEFIDPDGMSRFLRSLGENGFLQRLNGIIIGKLKNSGNFSEHKRVIKGILENEYEIAALPVLYGLNFGHTSPMFIIPYGARAEINCESKSFSILESGVV